MFLSVSNSPGSQSFILLLQNEQNHQFCAKIFCTIAIEGLFECGNELTAVRKYDRKGNHRFADGTEIRHIRI